MTEALNDIKACFEQRGIPENLYQITDSRLIINQAFLDAIRQYGVWKPLEAAFVGNGGAIVATGV